MGKLDFKRVKGTKITSDLVKKTKRAKEGGGAYNGLTEPGEYLMELVEIEVKDAVKSDTNWHGTMWTFKDVASGKTYRQWVPVPTGGTIMATTSKGEKSYWAYDKFAMMVTAIGYQIPDCVLNEDADKAEQQEHFDQAITIIMEELFGSDDSRAGLGAKCSLTLNYEGYHMKKENGFVVLYDESGKIMRDSVRQKLKTRDDLLKYMKTKRINIDKDKNEPQLGGLSLDKILPATVNTIENPLEGITNDAEAPQEQPDLDAFTNGVEDADETDSATGMETTD